MEIIKSLLALRHASAGDVSIALARPLREVTSILNGNGEFDQKDIRILSNMLGFTMNGRLSESRVHILYLDHEAKYAQHVSVLSSILNGGLASCLKVPRTLSLLFSRRSLATYRPYALQSKSGTRLVILAKKRFFGRDTFDISQFKDFSWGGGSKARSTVHLNRATIDSINTDVFLKPIDFDNIFTLRHRDNITWSDILKLAHKKGLNPMRLAAIIEAIPDEGEVPEISVITRNGVTVKNPVKASKKPAKKPVAAKADKVQDQKIPVVSNPQPVVSVKVAAKTSRSVAAPVEVAARINETLSDVDDFTLDNAYNAITKAA